MNQRIAALLELEECPALGICRPTLHTAKMASWLLCEVEAIAPEYSVGTDNGNIHIHWIVRDKELTLVVSGNPLDKNYIYHEDNEKQFYGIDSNLCSANLEKWMKWLIESEATRD